MSFEGLAQGTFLFADTGAKHIPAFFPECLFCGDAGDFLSGAIERRNAPLRIHREYTLNDGIKDYIGVFIFYVARHSRGILSQNAKI